MRVSWKTVSAVAVLVAAVLAIALFARRSAREPGPAETSVTHASAMPVAASSNVPVPSGAPASTSPLPVPPAVDLAALRAKLPDNVYWKLGVPVSDAAEQERRLAEERANNVLFGKVQSNTATPAEILAYYGNKRQVVTDYATFARTVVSDYGPKLTPDERNLYDLAIRMNDQRLKQIPHEETVALGRRRAYEARKAAASP